MNIFLTGIGCENVRVFQNHNDFKLSTINILTGTNSSGKSSLIKVILLLKDFFSKKANHRTANFSFDYDTITKIFGSEHGICNRNSNENVFCIEILGEEPEVLWLSNGEYEQSFFIHEYREYKDSNIKCENKYKIRIFFQVNKLSVDYIGYEIFKNGILSLRNIYKDDKIYTLLKLDCLIGNIQVTTPIYEYRKVNKEQDFESLLYEIEIGYGDNPIPLAELDSIDKFEIEAILKLEKEMMKEISFIEFEEDYRSSNDIYPNGLYPLFLNYGCKSGLIKNAFVKYKKNKLMDINDATKVYFDYLIERNIHIYDSKKFSIIDLDDLFDSFSNLVKEIDCHAFTRNTSEYNYHISDKSNELGRMIKNILLLTEKPKTQNYVYEIVTNEVKRFGIADNIKFKRDGDLVKIYLEKGGKKTLINMADLGYGVSQLLPIIFKISMSYCKFIIIEEPECNLHPALQSKLADMLIEMSKKYKMRFLIETHSEYLIRRLQTRTAEFYIDEKKSETSISKESTQIYYFYSPDQVPEDENQVYPINIMEDGSLTKNFGKGFYDEAGNEDLLLYQLAKFRKN